MRRIPQAVLVVTMAVACCGCGDSGQLACSNLIRTLDITVQDQSTGAAICNASVVMTSGSSSYPLIAQPHDDGGAACRYQPASYDPVPAGTYTVSASAPGYQSGQVQDVVITNGDGQPCVPYTYGRGTVKLTRP